MRICVAQTKSIIGDMSSNLERHKQSIRQAIANGADMIVFPELSLTGYNPRVSKALATTATDTRFDALQEISNENQITIGVGLPTRNNSAVCISMVLFQPHQPRQTYSKRSLHPDEEKFFIRGQNLNALSVGGTNVAFAICYELSIPRHAEQASEQGAEIYIASVAKSVCSVGKALERLREIASRHSMTVLMSNCVGTCDGVRDLES